MTWLEADGLIGRLAWLGILHVAWSGLAVSAAIAIAFQLRPSLSHRSRHTILLVGLAVVAIGSVGLPVGQHYAGFEATESRDQGRTLIVRVEQRVEVEPWDGAHRPGPGLTLSRSRWTAHVFAWVDLGASQARKVRPWALMAWSVAVAGIGIWLVVARVGVTRLVGRSSPAPERIIALGRVLASRLSLARQPMILVHPNLGEPCLCGSIRQVVLLPGRWLATANDNEVEAVLAHEFAHARRRDPLVNLVQRSIEATLFFQPGVWWLSTKLRIERELCADALAVEATGDPLGLARALESVARSRLESGFLGRTFPTSLAFGGDGLSLFSRIQELIGMTPIRPRPSCWPFAAIPAAVVFALLAVGVGSAQDVPKPVPDPEPKAPATAPPPAQSPKPRQTDPPQISYEVRFVTVEAGMLRRVPVTTFRPIDVEGGIKSCIANPKVCRAILEDAQRDDFTSNVIQAPRVTAFVATHAIISIPGATIQAGKVGEKPAPVEPGAIKVDVSGTLLPGATKLSVEVGAKLTGNDREMRGITQSKVPEGSSLVLRLGQHKRKVGDQAIMEETFILLTPRRIITEAEEQAIAPAPIKARMELKPGTARPPG